MKYKNILLFLFLGFIAQGQIPTNPNLYNFSCQNEVIMETCQGCPSSGLSRQYAPGLAFTKSKKKTVIGLNYTFFYSGDRFTIIDQFGLEYKFRVGQTAHTRQALIDTLTTCGCLCTVGMIPGAGDNLYTIDGALGANRTITSGGFSLTYDGTQDFILSDNGDIQATGYPSTRDDSGTFSPVNFLYTTAAGLVYSAPMTSSLVANIYTQNGTLTGMRTLNGGGNNMTWTNIDNGIFSTTGSWQLDNLQNIIIMSGAATSYNSDGAHTFSISGSGNEFGITADNLQFHAYLNTRDDDPPDTPINFLYTDASGNLRSTDLAAVGAGLLARQGVSLKSDTLVLGESVGDATDPSIFTEDRELPMDSYDLWVRGTGNFGLFTDTLPEHDFDLKGDAQIITEVGGGDSLILQLEAVTALGGPGSLIASKNGGGTQLAYGLFSNNATVQPTVTIRALDLDRSLDRQIQMDSLQAGISFVNLAAGSASAGLFKKDTLLLSLGYSGVASISEQWDTTGLLLTHSSTSFGDANSMEMNPERIRLEHTDGGISTVSSLDLDSLAGRLSWEANSIEINKDFTITADTTIFANIPETSEAADSVLAISADGTVVTRNMARALAVYTITSDQTMNATDTLKYDSLLLLVGDGEYIDTSSTNGKKIFTLKNGYYEIDVTAIPQSGAAQQTDVQIFVDGTGITPIVEAVEGPGSTGFSTHISRIIDATGADKVVHIRTVNVAGTSIFESDRTAINIKRL